MMERGKSDDARLSKHAEEIIQRLRDVTRSMTECPPDLNDAICRYVRVLKEEGLRSEQVVVLVNNAMAGSGLLDENVSPALKDDVVTRCIREYSAL